MRSQNAREPPVGAGTAHTRTAGSLAGNSSSSAMLLPLASLVSLPKAALPPGSLLRIANDEIRAFFQTKLSNHQLGLSDLLALLAFKGKSPRHIAIIGMVPHSLENRLGLTPEATAGLDGMVERLVAELAGLGVTLHPRAAAGTGHWRRQAELERAACA